MYDENDLRVAVAKLQIENEAINTEINKINKNQILLKTALQMLTNAVDAISKTIINIMRKPGDTAH